MVLCKSTLGVLLAVVPLIAVLVLPHKAVGQGQFVEQGFVEEVVFENLPIATWVSFAPDNRAFIALKDGIVRVARDGTLIGEPFVDISHMVNRRGDRGLLSLAVHPQFPVQPYIYLLFSYDPPGAVPDSTDPCLARLVRFTADASSDYNIAVPGSETVILGVNSTLQNMSPPIPAGDPNNPERASCMTGLTMNGTPIEDCLATDGLSHSVGAMEFAGDGTLFVSLGDQSPYGSAFLTSTRALLLDSLSGKVLRINAETGAGVADNPFYDPGKPSSNRSKVWAMGLRNGFRMALHPENGQPYVGDVGSSLWEEINALKGGNYGWPCYEGGVIGGPVFGGSMEGGNTTSHQQPSFRSSFRTRDFCQALYNQGLGAVTPPLFTYQHPLDINGADSGAAISGLAFYSGSIYPAKYRGALFFSDYIFRTIRYLTFDSNGIPTAHDFAEEVAGQATPVQIVSGPDSNLYVVYLDLPGRRSQIRRIRYNTQNSPPRVVINATPRAGDAPLTVTFRSDGTLDPDGQSLSLDWNFGDGAVSTQPHPIHTFNSPGSFTVRLTATETSPPFASSSETVTIRPGAVPPKITILSPTPPLNYAIGDVISYSGFAEDQGVRVPPNNLVWTVLQHHHTHQHLIDQLSGTESGEFEIEEHTDDTFYSVCLEAFSNAGPIDVRCVDIKPAVTPYTFDSSPPGAVMTYIDEERDVVAPYLAHPIVNSAQSVAAPAQHAGRRFLRWSDGSTSLEKSFTVGLEPQTFTAIYGSDEPVANLGLSTREGIAPLQVSFVGGKSFDPDGRIVKWEWSFGDGSTAMGQNVSHVYRIAGDFTVTLRVTDREGGVGVAQAKVHVLSPPAASRFCADSRSAG
ncbi:MAG: PQQ-dependent sugar dehydrogenase [Deltaproteobacteria bacterium]|nr:PQQ-dependent sugar dehydrogenase [Deltaproteobacteria bacterium]